MHVCWGTSVVFPKLVTHFEHAQRRSTRFDGSLTNNLHLNVDRDETLRQWVHLDQTRIDCACKATKPGDQAYCSLLHWTIWIWANNAAWNSTASSNDGTKAVDHASVPTMAAGVFLILGQYFGVRWLQILFARWLHVHEGVGCLRAI